MGELTQKTLFKAQSDKIWNILADVEKTPQWVEGVQSSQRTNDLEGLGLTWEEECLFGKQKIQVENEFKEWKPNKKAQIVTQLPMGAMMNRTIQFNPTPQGTEVTIEVKWDFGIATNLIGAEKLKVIFQDNLTKTLASWKEKAEKG